MHRSAVSPLDASRHVTVSEGERLISVAATLSGRTPIPAGEWERWAAAVRCVEVRADLTGDIDPGPIRRGFSGSLLYTLRSGAAGGGSDDTDDRRRARLFAAADRYDYVELEAGRDLRPEMLNRIPAERRVLSWYGPATDVAGLRRVFADLAAVGARLYRLVPAAETMAHALAPLLLLKSLRRRDVTAYARGPVATWTRVLAARYGAPVLFGRVENRSPEIDVRGQAEGELPLRRLLTDYPHRLLLHAEALYGLIGGSATLSVCPLAHNTAYRSLGLSALFLQFSSDELARSLEELRTGLDELGLSLRGMAVVAPHKEAAFALTADATPLARRIGSANLLVRTPAGWWGGTEAAGVIATLSRAGVTVTGRRIAVVGCGGAGRAAAAALSQAGAGVTLVNRGVAAGRRAAESLGLPFVPLPEFDPRPYSVLINATSVRDTLPFRIDGPPARTIFDLTYKDTETPLIAAARAAGHLAIDGRAMTLVELPRHFHHMTGRLMPDGIVRAAHDEFRRSRSVAKARGSSEPEPPGWRLLDAEQERPAMTAGPYPHQAARSTGERPVPTPEGPGLPGRDGTWISATRLSHGVALVSPRHTGTTLTVRAYGGGEPRPGDWGEVEADGMYALRSGAGYAFRATFHGAATSSHLQTNLAHGVMAIHAFHRFTDGSGRRDYYTREFFVPARAVQTDDGVVPGSAPGDGLPSALRSGPNDPTGLLGTWTVLDAATMYITALQCAQVDGTLTVRAHGAGPDGPVDWGTAGMDLYADAARPGGPPGFLSTFELGDRRVHLQARPYNGIIVAAQYVEYTDGSGHADFFTRDCFRR